MENICVIGLGYIGLPTASLFATRGYAVLGVDLDPQVVDITNQGRNHIEEVGLRTLVEAAVRSGKLTASLTPSASEIFIVAVPTPFDQQKHPDLSHVHHALESVLPLLREGNLLILESTVPPGTTLKMAERVASQRPDLVGDVAQPLGSLKVFVAHAPERVLPGQILKELVDNDRIVGGVTPEAGRRAARLYSSIVSGSIYKTDATTAEMVKLSENIFRDVNISLANEIAVVSERLGIDVGEVLSLANKHPRVRFLNPGPGVGGHCIAVDPWFVVAQFPDDTGLLRAARTRNDRMPSVVVNRALQLLQGIQDPKIAVLGASYKGNVGDSRNSPAVEIFRALEGHLAGKGTTALHDSHIVDTRLPLRSLDETLSGASLVLLLADHDEYRAMDPVNVARQVRQRMVFDTRRALDPFKWNAAGFDVYLLGRGRKYTPPLSNDARGKS